MRVAAPLPQHAAAVQQRTARPTGCPPPFAVGSVRPTAEEDGEAGEAGSGGPVLWWGGGLGVRDGANASAIDACNQSGSSSVSNVESDAGHSASLLLLLLLLLLLRVVMVVVVGAEASRTARNAVGNRTASQALARGARTFTYLQDGAHPAQPPPPPPPLSRGMVLEAVPASTCPLSLLCGLAASSQQTEVTKRLAWAGAGRYI